MAVKPLNLIGQKFGRLIVSERNGTDKHGRSTWICKCACGNEVIVAGTNLKKGITKSCGCLSLEWHSEFARKNTKEDRYSIGWKRLYKALKHRHKQKKQINDEIITLEQFIEKSKLKCHYCGAEPHNQWKDPTTNFVLYYNGLDRLDSLKGYTFENTVPCCFACNSHKMESPLEQFEKELDERTIQLAKHRFGIDLTQLIKR